MAVGDILKVVQYMGSEEQMGLNVRHYRVSAEVTGGASLTEIANALKAIFAPLYQVCLSSSAFHRTVGVQVIRPLPIGNEAFAGAFNDVGLRTGDPLPKQVSGLISLRTALAGRRNRGRVYVPFPAETSNNSSSEPDAVYIEGLGGIGTAHVAPRTVVGATGTTTIVPVIFRRVAGTTQDVVSFRVRLFWATQRRRGDFGKPNVLPV